MNIITDCIPADKYTSEVNLDVHVHPHQENVYYTVLLCINEAQKLQLMHVVVDLITFANFKLLS